FHLLVLDQLRKNLLPGCVGADRAVYGNAGDAVTTGIFREGKAPEQGQNERYGSGQRKKAPTAARAPESVGGQRFMRFGRRGVSQIQASQIGLDHTRMRRNGQMV